MSIPYFFVYFHLIRQLIFSYQITCQQLECEETLYESSIQMSQMKAPVQIIYLNGPSSSGKTTFAKALQDSLEPLFLLVGIDKIIGWMPEKVNDWTGGEAPLGFSWKKGQDASGHLIHELQSGPFAKKIAKTFQDIILLLAQKGHSIIIDDVSFGQEQIDEWKKLLRDFHVLWIGVNAPLDVIEQREKERGNRMVGSARAQFHKVHENVTYDLEIDTHHGSPSQNIQKIQELIAARGPAKSERFHFQHAKSSQKNLLEQWFQQPHIHEWMHGVGLQNTLNGLTKFFEGKTTTTYWIGYDHDTPFAFLITSPAGEDATTLDVFICDVNYLGKGLAVPMIRQFLTDHFSHMKKVLIDPEAANTRAIHVYKKVGFQIIGEFIASWHPVPHYQMELNMSQL